MTHWWLPPDAAHELPPASQRCHWYVYDVGVFVQVPVDADTVAPTCADPDTTGTAVFTGTGGGGGTVTTAVTTLTAGVEGPPVFVAMTTTRNVEPASPATTTYDALVAPTRSAHELPPASQRCHWYVYDVGVFVQVPVDADTVAPTCADPDTTGTAVFTGTGGGGGGGPAGVYVT